MNIACHDPERQRAAEVHDQDSPSRRPAAREVCRVAEAPGPRPNAGARPRPDQLGSSTTSTRSEQAAAGEDVLRGVEVHQRDVAAERGREAPAA